MVWDKLSSSDVLQMLNDPRVVILDARPSAAFNGWPLMGEDRGGHIPGAINMPLAWVGKYGDDQLKSVLTSNGVLAHKRIVICAFRAEDCIFMAEWLISFGFGDVAVLSVGMAEWAADQNLPLDYVPNFEKLVHAQWLDAVVRKPNPAHLLFEVSQERFAAYKAGHIPGALHLDLGRVEEQPDWNVCADDELLDVLLSWGISASKMVVLYGKDPMAAFRAANVLHYAGVDDVRILDGGYDAWKSFGGKIEVGVQQPAPIKEFGSGFPGRPDCLIGIEEARSILSNKNAELVSVRSWDEYLGLTSGYDFILPKGRIAGAVWGHSGSGPDQMQDYRNPDNTMRSFRAIAANWRGAGIVPEKSLAFYCGTGWRAAEAYFYATLMGWQNIAVYDGGWLEWSLDDGNPIESGLPE